MFEGKTFEYDPGYDPERLDGGGENTESTPERNREVTPLIVNVDCQSIALRPKIHIVTMPIHPAHLTL